MSAGSTLSIVIPAKNEAAAIGELLRQIRTCHSDAEILVIDDGSTDRTAEIARSVDGVQCISHPVCIGNGGAIKTGARLARGDYVVFMDGDGQHRAADIGKLVARLDAGFDLVVGSRDLAGQASPARAAANGVFNRLASYMTGCHIADLTSGFRAVRRERFLTILYLLPNRFSYPTTSTMAFFRSGYFVDYVPVDVQRREGSSHIRMLRDGARFLIIILKIGTLFSPMRLFLPVSSALFGLASAYYLYTYAQEGRFTNMGMLMYLSALSTFLIGIVSEQVSALHYKDTSRAPRTVLSIGEVTASAKESAAAAGPPERRVKASLGLVSNG